MMTGNYISDFVGFSYFFEKIQPRSLKTQPSKYREDYGASFNRNHTAGKIYENIF